MASCGLDRFTGQPLRDWDHVLQSVDVICETEPGERIMLGYFYGGMRHLLGRKLTPDHLALAAFVIGLTIAIWEPRLRVVKVSKESSADEVRLGAVSFIVEVAYRPRGHLGDFTEERAYFGVGFAENGRLQATRMAA